MSFWGVVTKDINIEGQRMEEAKRWLDGIPFGWVHQHRGVGDFLIFTPSLQVLARKQGRPVPVWFERPDIRNLYRNAPFVKVLEKRPETPTFLENGCRYRGRGRYESTYRRMAKQFGLGGAMPLPWPFPDIEPILEGITGREVAIINGANRGGRYGAKKILPPDLLELIISTLQERKLIPVPVGGTGDRGLGWFGLIEKWNLEGKFFAGETGLLDVAKVLKSCGRFISDDTGLMHLGAALNLPGLVFWRHTDTANWKPPSRLVAHVRGFDLGEVRDAVTAFLDRLGLGRDEEESFAPDSRYGQEDGPC